MLEIPVILGTWVREGSISFRKKYFSAGCMAASSQIRGEYRPRDHVRVVEKKLRLN
jgi:hypothetical protein